MAQTAAAASPTEFHELLATLNSRGTLLRVYTQNIDGLELKSGLGTVSGYSVPNQGDSVCIPLHGNIHQLRCQSCGSSFSMHPYLSTLKIGDLPACDTCKTARVARVQLNLQD